MIRFDRAEASLLRYRLDKPVGGSGVGAVDVIIVELKDSDGATGLGFTYVLGGVGGETVLAAARGQLNHYLVDQPLLPPQALWRRISSSFNRTGFGPNLIALAAVDMAVWDMESRRRGLALGSAMGGALRPVSVYGSGGFTANQTPAEAAATAVMHASRGFGAVKVRVRGTARSDRKLLEAVRDALPESVHLMLDANEKCDLLSAMSLMSAAADCGALFMEEPLPGLAVEGYRALARSGRVAIAAGEHLQGRAAFLPFISEQLVAVIQPDLAMAGGLTPILEIAALAEAFDVAVSPHFLPGLFVHLAAACPNLSWLEDFPLLEPLFEGWPAIQENGLMTPREEAGHGLSLTQGARQKFSV